jgi:hypothetical protein
MNRVGWRKGSLIFRETNAKHKRQDIFGQCSLCRGQRRWPPEHGCRVLHVQRRYIYTKKNPPLLESQHDLKTSFMVSKIVNMLPKRKSRNKMRGSKRECPSKADD